MKILPCWTVLALLCGGLPGPGGAALAAGDPLEETAPGRLPAAVAADAAALPSWENGAWLLGGALLTVGVHQFEDAEGAAAALHEGIWGGLSDAGNVWGDLRFQAPLALGTWGVGHWAGSGETAALGCDLTRGLLLTYTATSILKVACNRTRPNGEDYSFPSGHTAAAFTTAGVVTTRYGGWAGGVTLGLGLMTAMGRMGDMKHYASDVAAGATIGWIIGRTVARRTAVRDTAWQVVPWGRGLAMVRRF